MVAYAIKNTLVANMTIDLPIMVLIQIKCNIVNVSELIQYNKYPNTQEEYWGIFKFPDIELFISSKFHLSKVSVK